MKTLVYGLGESGAAACRALLERGKKVVAADARETESLRKLLENLGVEGYLEAGPEVLEGVGQVVASPGIPPRDAVLRAAEERGIPVLSEAALGLRLLGPEVRVAAVTGTNGKTTVVDMLRCILAGAGISHAVAGNSWRALTGCLEAVKEAGLLVLELSSFQLHYLENGAFEVAALLNVRPDHLNWHTSFEEYVRDKLRIFEGQGPGDLAVVDSNDVVGRKAAKSLKSQTLVVGENGTGVWEGNLFLRGTRIISEAELRFAGVHNLENALFASAMAEKLGVSLWQVRNALRDYRLKPHRMEVVAEREGVLYVDDSKATNPAAVAAALQSFDKPVVLILGGSEKDTDFGEILPHLDRCRGVVCQGEAGPRIFRSLREAGLGERARLAPDLAGAVAVAKNVCRAGDVVLLSPGCASFDQFTGYAERGDAFADLVGEDTGAHGKAVGQ